MRSEVSLLPSLTSFADFSHCVTVWLLVSTNHNGFIKDCLVSPAGLFLITAGTEKPEMVEVLASSKEERNTWMAIIQDAMQCM